jgi:hypothetical protein
VAFDFPADLLALEARAWEEIQAGALTVDTAHAVHAGIDAFVRQAKEAGREVARYDVEMGLKRVVRPGEREG